MFTFKKIALAGTVVAALSMVSCSDTDPEDKEPVDLVKRSITLSLADKSYGDIDAGKSYGQADLSSKAEDIDVVAYYTTGADDKVKNPCIVPTIGPDDCGDPELYKIPEKYWSALVSGQTTADIVDFLDAFGDDKIDTDANADTEISIKKNSAFLVLTTDVDYYVVVISDNGTETVSLKFSNTGLK